MTGRQDGREISELTFDEGLRRSPLVVTCVDDDGSVVAMPADWAWAEATTTSTLQAATTFGQARADAYAAELVASWLVSFLELRRAEGDAVSQGADDEPFDVEEFFGEDNRLVWRADPRVSTANFLAQDHPELACCYLRVAAGTPQWFEEDAPVIEPKSRTALESDLRSRGHEVLPWPALAQTLLWPTKEGLDALRELL